MSQIWQEDLDVSVGVVESMNVNPLEGTGGSQILTAMNMI